MTGPDLRLATIAVEGAADFFFGRPRQANPYCPTYARDQHEAWSLGWDDARWYLDIRGVEECARWLGAS